MNKLKSLFFKSISLILIFSFLLMGITSAESVGNTDVTDNSKTLNVALYGYVPRPSQFKEVVSNNFKALEPDVSLNFVDWDCYSDDPSNNIDVFVFDAIFLTYFAEKGYLMPFSPDEIDNKDDIFNFALNGCKNDGTIYGIPQLGCTNLFFYRKDDKCLKNVKNVVQMHKILGDNNSSELPPPPNRGLLLDMSGGTTCACMYLETLIDVNKRYTDYDKLPNTNNLSKIAIDNLKLLLKMAGKEQSQYVPDPYDSYIRASWFAQGYGRAYIGYTESMMNMGDKVNDIDFKLFSLSKTSDIPVFYSDIVGVNSSIKDENKINLAKKLANVIASADTIEECIRPANSDKYPQYLLPVRRSVYQKLSNDFPVYKKLYELISKEKNIHTFRIGSTSREWIESAKDKIRNNLGL